MLSRIAYPSRARDVKSKSENELFEIVINGGPEARAKRIEALSELASRQQFQDQTAEALKTSRTGRGSQDFINYPKCRQLALVSAPGFSLLGLW